MLIFNYLHYLIDFLIFFHIFCVCMNQLNYLNVTLMISNNLEFA